MSATGCFRWLLVVLLLDFGPIAAAAKPLRPNIVLILADDLGYSDLGCYGSEISTPSLDKLASHGLRFSQFYTTPRCCPTRAALLTGMYPQQAGIGLMMEDRELPGYRGELNRRCLTMAEELRRAGYRTLMVGKWHVSHISFDGKRQLNRESNQPFWDHKESWPLQRGFDEYYGTIHGVNSYFDPFSLVRNNTPLEPQGGDFYYTDAISDQAVDDIERHGRSERPFFLYVAYTAPHWPLQAPAADIAKYKQLYLEGWDAIRLRRHQRQLELGLFARPVSLSPRDPRVPPWEKAANQEWEANRMATYAAMIERMDLGIGRILAKLDEKGISKDTLVLFLSDNGACAEVIQPSWYDVPSRTRDGRPIKAGDRFDAPAGPDDVWQSYGLPWANVSNTPFRLYKHFAHEGGISTPLIASWPAVIKQAATVADVGHVTDILATFVDVAGAEHPATFRGQAIQPLEGRTLLPIFEGNSRPQSNPLFWEHEGHRAVRRGRWKLVSKHAEGWQLYDIETDRAELTDLAAQHGDLVKELAALYERWAARCGVVAPEQLPRPRTIIPAVEPAEQRIPAQP